MLSGIPAMYFVSICSVNKFPPRNIQLPFPFLVAIVLYIYIRTFNLNWNTDSSVYLHRDAPLSQFPTPLTSKCVLWIIREGKVMDPYCVHHFPKALQWDDSHGPFTTLAMIVLGYRTCIAKFKLQKRIHSEVTVRARTKHQSSESVAYVRGIHR